MDGYMYVCVHECAHVCLHTYWFSVHIGKWSWAIFYDTSCSSKMFSFRGLLLRLYPTDICRLQEGVSAAQSISQDVWDFFFGGQKTQTNGPQSTCFVCSIFFGDRVSLCCLLGCGIIGLNYNTRLHHYHHHHYCCCYHYCWTRLTLESGCTVWVMSPSQRCSEPSCVKNHHLGDLCLANLLSSTSICGVFTLTPHHSTARQIKLRKGT
uniref:Gamma-glutamyltransferase n=1 Tax=Brugia malayi TaxID=6279 RepID=Q27449_BRUMA|nr:gamma-glutamyltransferase [Brugia malayi]